MGIHRSALARRRRSDAIQTRAENRIVKEAERARRDARMQAKIKAGALPYTPPVMSWLSRTLDKPASRITAEDVKQLLA